MCASPAYYWVSDQVVYHLRGLLSCVILRGSKRTEHQMNEQDDTQAGSADEPETSAIDSDTRAAPPFGLVAG